MGKLTQHQRQLADRVTAMAPDQDGWRERPDDLTPSDNRTLCRWYRAHWIDLEEDGSILVTPAGRAALKEQTP
jgi:hypothetical protein